MKGTVHNRIQKYACVTPDQMIQDIKFSPNGLLQDRSISVRAFHCCRTYPGASSDGR